MNGIKELQNHQKPAQNVKVLTGTETEKTKKCSKCGEVKKLSYFYIKKTSTDGFHSWCKHCCSKSGKKSYQKSKEKVSIYGKIYRKKNADHIRKIKAKRYIEVIKPNYQRNRDRILKRRSERRKERIQEDVCFKIQLNCRARVRQGLIRSFASKYERTIDLIGCSYKFLKLYIESQFKAGMNWENYGKYGWHIDHIKPCVSFDLTDRRQQKECFHYTNLQPLWAKENLKKGAKVGI